MYENSRQNISTSVGFGRANSRRSVPDTYTSHDEFSPLVAVFAFGTHPPAAKYFFRLGPAND
jgi:hypothetical protein